MTTTNIQEVPRMTDAFTVRTARVRARTSGLVASVALVALPLLPACTETDPAPLGHLETPAAPGSGQPFLAADDDGVWMSWTEPAEAGHRVAVSHFDAFAGRWSDPQTVAAGDGFFVNWADFPSIQAVGGRLVAHWLQRGGQGTYDYGVRLAWSDDSGSTWSEPWTPHEDGTPTEHGFVSIFETGGGVWAAWLDGRAMIEPGGPMAVRARLLPLPGPEAEGVTGAETVVDARSCECCQTDAVVAGGVPVLAFRDRAEGEVRDIHVSRWMAAADDGAPAWTPSVPVHDDGWVIGGCPVNGPAMAAQGDRVAVAWFTAPEGEARVNVAFSEDAAASFGPPVRVDRGQPIGRTDVHMLDDGSAIVTWLERTAEGTVILGRRVAANGSAGDPRPLADSDAARASGFPRIARLGPDRLMLAWTDPTGGGQVRAAVFNLDGWGAP